MKLNYFNFKVLNEEILMTNDFGKYVFVSKDEFRKIVQRKVIPQSELWEKLIDSKMIFDENTLSFSSKNRYELREQKNHLNIATSLHIFVITTACNMNCIYCQANNGKEVPHMYMTKETAEKAVDIALQSPAHYLDFEFQGGEPLLNFEIIKHIVQYAEIHKGTHEISYSVVTNLTLITDDILDFFEQHNFGISTSLDGPQKLHNNNRPFKDGSGTYNKVTESISRVRKRGMYVGAIQTTTKYSLEMPEELIESYRHAGFDSIFIRPLTQLGKASYMWNNVGYTAEEFLEFYKSALDKIIDINKTGMRMKEDYAAILLSKIFGNFVNYMELRSPCGAGIGQIAYYCDGNVFTCDEGRMLYEMGKDTFKLGNVYENTYIELVNNSVCRTVCASSVLETVPSCCDCVYQPYCGVCPVVNYALNDDVLEKEPRSYRCKIYSGILDYLFTKLSGNDNETIEILHSWSR